MSHHGDEHLFSDSFLFWVVVIIIALIIISGCGMDSNLATHQLPMITADRYQIPIELVPMPPVQIWEKGCWLDDDCNDGVDCTGREWCCSDDEMRNGIPCEWGKCYNGISPCGQPIASVLAICDLEYDTCRGCQSDEECNVDTKYTHVNWSWCGGPRRCGREGEGPSGRHHGICLGTGEGFPCEWNEVCNEELEQCDPQPECRSDRDCTGLESWCDENGKCHDQ